jgi:hypothetical protein
LAALTAPLYSDFYQTLPDWTRPFTGSIISMAVVVAAPLNALFLLGSWRYSQVRLGADSPRAEEERAGVNEMHTRRPIHSVSGINFAGAGPRWRLSDALARSLQSQRSRSKKGLAFGRKRSMCVDVRMC